MSLGRCGILRFSWSDSCLLEVGADLGLLGFPVLEFLGAVFLFRDLAFGFWRDPGVVGEVDFRGLIEVVDVGRRGVIRDLRH